MSNIDAIRGAYASFQAGDIPGVLAVFDADIEWIVPGRGGLAGTYKGSDGVVTFFTELAQRSGGTFQLDVIDLMGSADRVVAVVRERATRGEQSLDVVNLHYWDMRDGRAIRFVGYEYDQYAEDEFYGG
jgi:ketosteroid isomerase-like protein